MFHKNRVQIYDLFSYYQILSLFNLSLFFKSRAKVADYSLAAIYHEGFIAFYNYF
jgi:hypothetical protein